MRRAVLLGLALVLAACRPGPPTAATPSPEPTWEFSPGTQTADRLCQLLGPNDWAGVGFGFTDWPEVSDDGADTGSAHCTYGTSFGVKVEPRLDVFVGPTVDDARLKYAQLRESFRGLGTPHLTGIDEATINSNAEPDSGAIIARAGKLVVTITMPTSAHAGDQLTSLAQTVLIRALALE